MAKSDTLTLNKEVNKSKFSAELLLQKNNKYEQDYYFDKNSLAHIIQNVIIYEKGTYPNQPQLGLGIENYMFEFLDKDFLINLESDIKTQIAMFVPSLYNIDVMCESKKKDNLVGLFIYISIKDSSIDTNGNVIENENIISLVVGSDLETKKFISKLIA